MPIPLFWCCAPFLSKGILQCVKIFVRLGMVVSGVLSLIALSVSVSQLLKLGIRQEDDIPVAPIYHFSIYLPDTQDSFFTAIKRGVESAAEEQNVAVSYHSIDPVRLELQQASYTGVDGVAICPYLDDVFAKTQIEKIVQKQIPVILINHLILHDQPWPYIGPNSFDIGRKMGMLLSRLGHEPIRLAIVYSKKAPGIYAERELVEMGLTSSIGNRLSTSIKSFYTGRNPLDAEMVMYRLLREEPEINTLVFTDANDTIAATQALIDMNLVGRIQIIGFGNEKSIIEYIHKGVIAGTIAINPERIGYQAIKSLYELKATGYTSTSVNTGVEILDRSQS